MQKGACRWRWRSIVRRPPGTVWDVACLASNGAHTAAAPAVERRYAVVGAGFAGLATAWHLLDEVGATHSVHVDVFDAAGIGAGGSGAAAGLLHPFTPKGKLLWKGEEAMAEAVRLLDVAAAAAHHAGMTEPIAWRQGMLRPATNAKQTRDFYRAWGGGGGAATSTQARCLSADDAAALLPGLARALDKQQQAQQQAAIIAGTSASSTHAGLNAVPDAQLRQQRRRQAAANADADAQRAAAALHIPGGITLHPQRYMRALWAACEQHAATECAPGSGATLHRGVRVASVADLTAQQAASSDGGGAAYDAVVVAAGAAVGSIAEAAAARLPLDLCQGYSLDLVPGSDGGGGEYPPGAPSMLGSPYAASQGGAALVVGATKAHGWSSEAALQECVLSARGGRGGRDGTAAEFAPGGARHAEAAAAAAELIGGAAAAWPPVQRWRVAAIRSGVRALPPRTPQGSIPLVGKLPQRDDDGGDSVQRRRLRPEAWLLVGLGARGLVYHAWLGALVARAVAAGGDERGIPRELLAWRRH